MSKYKTLNQVSTFLNSTSNPTAILKHSYNLDRIVDCENKSEIANHLHDVLTADVALKGLKDIPSAFIYQDVLKMIMKRYYFLTPLEIELALQMDRYGELENKESHYQFYGTEYVGSILQRYVSWKQQKAMELNLIRKVNQIENKPDIDKINKDYLDTILNEIRSGKELHSIQSHRLFDEIPKDELPTKEQGINLYNEQSEKVKNRFELKKLNEKDTLRVKQLTEIFTKTFESDVKTRCRNIVTCQWLAKKHNIELNDNQF